MKRLVCVFILLFLCCGLTGQSISETLFQIESAKKELETNRRTAEHYIADFQKNSSNLAPQDSFESDFEYLSRLMFASPEIQLLRLKYTGESWLKLLRLRSRTWYTDNVNVTFGKYDPNTRIWSIKVHYNDYQAEEAEFNEIVEGSIAREVSKNQSRLLVKGVLMIGLDDKIELAKIHIDDPVTGFKIDKDLHPLMSFTGSVLSFSNDGHFLCTIKGPTVKLYDTYSNLEVSDYKLGASVSAVAFSPDCKYLVIGSMDNYAQVVSLEHFKIERRLSFDRPVRSVNFSHCSRYLAVGWGESFNEYGGGYSIFDMGRNEFILSNDHGKQVDYIAFHPYDLSLVTTWRYYEGCANYSYGSTMYDILTQLALSCMGIPEIEIIPIFDPYECASIETEGDEAEQEFYHMIRQGIVDFGGVTSLAFSPDGGSLALAQGNQVKVLDLTSHEVINQYDHGAQVVWSPVGTYLAISGSGKTQIINTTTGKQHYLYELEGNLAFSPDGRFLAIGDAIYRTFITAEGAEPEKSISHPPQLVAKVEFTEPSGNKFLDALEKGSLKISVGNTGQGDGVGLTVKLEPSKIAGLNYLNGFIAQIPAGKTIDLDIPLEAYIEVADGTHTLNISFEEANGFPPAPLQLTFSTRAYKRPEFLISEVGIDDSNKNGKIEAGEMIQLTIRARNKGQGTASGAYAKFYAGENVFITDKHAKTQSMGEFKPGQSVDLPLEIFINERCLNDIPLYVDFTEATGLAGVSKLWVPITKSDATRQISKIVVSGVEESYSVDTPAPLNIDVEQNIPSSKQARTSDYAVIFGVEQYPSPTPRAIYSARDATWFKEYAAKALGIPQANIYFRVNESVTKNEFNKVFGRSGWLDLRVSAESRVYFFFSGHGIPSQTEGKAYILPYDGDPNYAALTAYPLQDVYDGLSRLKSAQSLVFLDACFTGMARENHPLYASARPVFLAPEKLAPPSKVNVLSASQSKQMSNAWPDKQHGLFSYFLMKGMQGSADANQDKRITLAEMQTYLAREIPPQAGRLDKEQVPHFSGSGLDTVLIEY